jgi:hypothetical protein
VGEKGVITDVVIPLASSGALTATAKVFKSSSQEVMPRGLSRARGGQLAIHGRAAHLAWALDIASLARPGDALR